MASLVLTTNKLADSDFAVIPGDVIKGICSPMPVRLVAPNFLRKPGCVKGTFELVAHANYIVILEEDAQSVTALSVVHARQQWP